VQATLDAHDLVGSAGAFQDWARRQGTVTDTAAVGADAPHAFSAVTLTV